MKEVGIGLIGAGARLTILVNMLTSRYPWIKIVAINDPSKDSIASALKKLNPQAKVYDDYRDLVKDPAVKWVFVGSWNCFHREHAVTAMEAGKDVFCEKPLATNLDDCLAIKNTQKITGKIFFIGFTLRYAPLYQQINMLLGEGAIGDIISMEFNETLRFNHGGYIHRDWRRHTKYAGTHLLEKCCHDIDQVHWMVNSLPIKVSSFGGNDFFIPANKKHMERVGPNPKNGAKAFCEWEYTNHPDPFTDDKDIVDNQVAIIQFSNGVRSTFHTNCCAGIPERRMYIIGTEGALRGDLYACKLELQKYGWDEPRLVWYPGTTTDHGGGDHYLVEQIATAIEKHIQPESSVDEGLKSAITCFAIDKAMQTGTVVNLMDLWKKAEIEVY